MKSFLKDITELEYKLTGNNPKYHVKESDITKQAIHEALTNARRNIEDNSISINTSKEKAYKMLDNLERKWK